MHTIMNQAVFDATVVNFGRWSDTAGSDTHLYCNSSGFLCKQEFEPHSRSTDLSHHHWPSTLLLPRG